MTESQQPDRDDEQQQSGTSDPEAPPVEELDQDPAHEPPVEELKDLKGG